jgi:hypothetical protein
VVPLSQAVLDEFQVEDVRFPQALRIATHTVSIDGLPHLD